MIQILRNVNFIVGTKKLQAFMYGLKCIKNVTG